ncbi:MAG: thiamine phosphate synthase, partial [[Clostridium] fimetarium]|nr:thiamine phosphate synthase [[Clostridium] fimetarium]
MSAGTFRLAAITGIEIYPGEAEAITRLLERGWWRVHIRKPGAPSDAVEALINDIPAPLRERLSLHDHFHLATRLGVGGLHLNMRHQSPTAGWRGMLSQSCHSVEEVLANRGKLDYMFLSPVFDSISKPGYSGKFSPEELAASGALGPDLFALGGVMPREL